MSSERRTIDRGASIMLETVIGHFNLPRRVHGPLWDAYRREMDRQLDTAIWLELNKVRHFVHSRAGEDWELVRSFGEPPESF